jgi:hypothetical protein
MKKIITSGFVAAGLLIGTTTAAFADDATATVTTTLQAAVTLTKNTDMSFGTLLIGSASEVITLSSGGGRSSTGSAVFSGSGVAADFTATGASGSALTITVANTTLTGPGSAMALNNFTHSAGVSPVLTAAGSLTFTVGGDLAIGTSQTVGNYDGTVTVTVNYQ